MKRAARVTSFNLTSADFNTTKYKREIQSLYQQYIFKSFDPEATLTSLDVQEYNRLVKRLKSDDASQYEKLHNLPLRGIGPAEAVLFLLTKYPNGNLGGGSSAGVDFVFGSKKYEVKAVKWKSKTTKDYVADFKLGGNIPGMTQLESEIQRGFYQRGYTSSLARQKLRDLYFKNLLKSTQENTKHLKKDIKT